MRYTIRQLKFAILEALMHSQKNYAHTMSIIGRSYSKGEMEHILDTTFTDDERALAGKAFNILKNDLYITPTYEDVGDPMNWVRITSKGREALKLNALDDLDLLLRMINPNLIELREGAWLAILSNDTDSSRQASHSARELIDQVIKESIPDKVVKSDPNFTKDKSSSSGITRKYRLKLLITKEDKTYSKSDLKILEKSCELIIALDDKLKGWSHSRENPPIQEVKDTIILVEITLRKLLNAKYKI